MSFVARLERVVAERADAVAIEDADRRLTYGELWRATEPVQIARDALVPLRHGRSADHVIAMIAAWRAGAAFLPLDPASPPLRDAALLAEAGTNGDGLAYAIATSGSTGRPKIVEVGHDGIVPVLDAQIAAFDVDATARVLWMLSPAFDASLSDIGTALLAGATLVVAPQLDGVASLEALLDRRAITHVDLPPALLPLLAHAPKSLRTIVIGGEVCPAPAVRAWAERVRLVNVYGPTEATICTSLCRCDASWDAARIGEPLPDVRYDVVDGELRIAGIALARGYRGRPDLTARRFVVDDGVRWYMTGDRVRVLPDGGLAFVGRIDRQLKVAGKLVAPEEIEARLAEHPRVRRASVTRDAGGLVARVVADDTSADELRAHLEARVPSWMVPGRVVFERALSETSSGKVSLPNHLATRLAELWSDVLERRVTPDEPVGADSLAVLRMVAAAEADGIPLEPAAVARARTARDLADDVDRDAKRGARDADDLRADAAAILAAADLRDAARPAPDLRCVAMTGATGLLGRRLLAALLEATRARVVAIVRDPSALRETDRVRVVRGDLAAPRLGLDARAWDALRADVDAVVHAGARVHLTASYEELREPNVVGTARIVALAAGKALHYVSTLSVFVATDRDRGIAREDDDLAATRVVHGGYAQSKLAAELVVRGAAARLDGLGVYRLGLVPGARHDILARFVRGIASLGCVPDDLDPALRFDVTDLDFAAGALASAVARRFSGTLHVASTSPPSLGDLLEAMAAEGVRVARVPSRVFAARARSDDEATAVLASCRRRDAYARHRTMDLFQATDIAFETRAPAPPATVDVLRRYVREAIA